MECHIFLKNISGLEQLRAQRVRLLFVMPASRIRVVVPLQRVKSLFVRPGSHIKGLLNFRCSFLPLHLGEPGSWVPAACVRVLAVVPGS